MTGGSYDCQPVTRQPLKAIPRLARGIEAAVSYLAQQVRRR